MSRTTAIRDAWRPQTRQDRDAILVELEEILASPHFCNSKRYPALLKYIVEKSLAGESDALKERTLGVEVFDRPPSYDTNTDTVVRYTAGEVRKRLSLYYHELDRKPVIQISLPAGSYIPEFLHALDEVEDGHAAVPREGSGLVHEAESIPGTALVQQPFHVPVDFGVQAGVAPSGSRSRSRGVWLALAVVVLAGLAGLGWRYHAVGPRTPLDAFWAPVLRDQPVVPICIGGSVFSQSHTSGVATAGKDIDYPFVSMQTVSAVLQLSGLMGRSSNTNPELQAAATTPLTELREHPVILLGGYNNQWTLRLVEPLRFHFWEDAAQESIVDTTKPGTRWARDAALPYSSADDYALVARFRSPTTDGWVVALAGVGRNGTEAAAQFVTSPHYMQMLRDKVGSDFANRNIEVVLKVNVIDGKTGAPSIVDWYAW